MVTISSILEDSFQTWKKGIPLFLIAMLIFAAVSIITNVGMTYVSPTDAQIEQAFAFDDDANITFADITTALKQVFTPEFIVGLIITMILTSLMSLLVAAFIISGFKSPNPQVAFTNALSRFFPLVIYSFVASIVSIFAYAFFIIPGIILSVYLLFTSYAIVLRNKDPINGFKYSVKLVETNFWRLIGHFFVFILIMIAVIMILTVVSLPINLVVTFIPGIANTIVTSIMSSIYTVLQLSVVYTYLYLLFVGIEEEKGLLKKSPVQVESGKNAPVGGKSKVAAKKTAKKTTTKTTTTKKTAVKKTAKTTKKAVRKS